MGIRNLFGLRFQGDNFQAWAKNNFGDYMYKIFFKPYTEQFWGVPCEELSTDCVPQVTKTSFMKTLKRVFFDKFANESLSIEEVDVGDSNRYLCTPSSTVFTEDTIQVRGNDVHLPGYFDNEASTNRFYDLVNHMAAERISRGK